MTKEDKQLLIKDLCARLPYGVKLDNGLELRSIDVLTKVVSCSGSDRKIDFVKPYLRPMSTMTKKEKIEVTKLGVCDDGAFHNDIYDIGIGMDEAFTAISWFLERHFDINYLIEKGLALEAPENMYKQ